MKSSWLPSATPSQELQSQISTAIEMGERLGKSGNELCQYINGKLTKLRGLYWNCFIDPNSFTISFTEGAYFEHRGVDWVVYRTSLKDERLPRRGSSTNVSKNDSVSIRKERDEFKRQLNEARADYESLKKDFKNYVRKTERVKAILQEILGQENMIQPAIVTK